MPPRKSLSQPGLSFALVDNMEPTKVGSLMKIFNAGGGDFFLTTILASGEPTTAEPTRLLRSKSLRQIPAKNGEVDRWVIFIIRWTLTGGFLKRSMTPWPITPCRTLPRTRTALKEEHGRGGKSKELGDMEL